MTCLEVIELFDRGALAVCAEHDVPVSQDAIGHAARPLL